MIRQATFRRGPGDGVRLAVPTADGILPDVHKFFQLADPERWVTPLRPSDMPTREAIYRLTHQEHGIYDFAGIAAPVTTPERTVAMTESTDESTAALVEAAVAVTVAGARTIIHRGEGRGGFVCIAVDDLYALTDALAKWKAVHAPPVITPAPPA